MSDFIRQLIRHSMLTWGPRYVISPGPPEPMVREIFDLLTSHGQRILNAVHENKPEGREELDQFVVAYGLGWRRSPDLPCSENLGDWSGIWDGAFAWLTNVVRQCLFRTSMYLQFGLVVPGYAFRSSRPDLSEAVVERSVRWLIEGRCRCPFIYGDGPRRSQLRSLRCKEEHAIAGWNPATFSFRGFVWQALKGPKPKEKSGIPGSFSPKALAQGMHFHALYFLCHIRLAQVLVWVCVHDGSSNFEGYPCLRCMEEGRGHFLDPFAFRTVETRLLVPRNKGGRHDLHLYSRCQHCCKQESGWRPGFPGEHFYPKALGKCPKCGLGRTRGAKFSTVWLLSPPDGPRRPGWVRQAGGPGGNVEVGFTENELTLLAGINGNQVDGSSSDEVLSGVYSAEVLAAVASLPPLERVVIEMRHLDGRSRVAVAAELKLGILEVKRLERAGLALLKKILIKEEICDEDE